MIVLTQTVYYLVRKNNNANLDVIYDPTNNNNTEISYLKNFGNFNLKLNSNYSLFSKIMGLILKFLAPFSF